MTRTRPAGEDELVALADADRLEAVGASFTDVERCPDGHLRAHAWFEDRPPDAVLRAALVREEAPDGRVDTDARALWVRPLAAFTPLPVPPLDRRPVALGGLDVHAPPADPGPSRLVIEAREGFGTGLHPTTAMMLALAGRGAPAGRILDVGTGSGILALHALVRGGGVAVGTDVRPAALAAARANAARNRVADRFETQFDLPEGRFELVLANIRGPTLIRLAPALLARLAPGGRLLLSGLRFFELEAVEAAFLHGRDAPAIISRGFLGGFCALELAGRTSAPPLGSRSTA